MESGSELDVVLLDVVVGEGAAILELLAREDEALPVGGEALLVLDLGFDNADGVIVLHVRNFTKIRKILPCVLLSSENLTGLKEGDIDK